MDLRHLQRPERPAECDWLGLLEPPLVKTDKTPPALLDFDGYWLDPFNTYTLAEYAVWAGWTSLWWIDNGRS